jgi:histidinol-phosphatase (PHP family)
MSLELPELPADYHMHTPLCCHAEGAPVEYARVAKALGLPEIGFSDHSPMPEKLDNWRMLREELPRYLEWIDEAREAVPELPIRLGLEIDYFESGEPWIQELATLAPWDYLIGSVHYLGDWAMDDPAEVRRFGDHPIEEIWERYWQLFGKAARSGCFDLMAHPDLVKKFSHRPAGDLRRFYEPAIQAVLDAGIAIEINTAGLYKPVGEMYPAPEFLMIAAEAGVPLCISSDAHAPTEVGRSFSEAVALAKQCGFHTLTRFHERKRRAVAF